MADPYTEIALPHISGMSIRNWRKARYLMVLRFWMDRFRPTVQTYSPHKEKKKKIHASGRKRQTVSCLFHSEIARKRGNFSAAIFRHVSLLKQSFSMGIG